MPVDDLVRWPYHLHCFPGSWPNRPRTSVLPYPLTRRTASDFGTLGTKTAGVSILLLTHLAISEDVLEENASDTE